MSMEKQAKISSEEWLGVWDDVIKLETDNRKLKEDILLLKDELYRVSQRVWALERKN